MSHFIPIVAGVLFRLGGMDQVPWIPFSQKLFRWLMGIVIGLMLWKGWIIYGITIGLYFLATNVFSYGKDNWTTELFGKWVSMGIAGLTYGLASIMLLGWFWGGIQGIVGMISFLVLKWLDDTDKLKNPWQEFLRGALGTILFIK